MMAVLYFFIVAHRTAATRPWLDTECARCPTRTTLTHFYLNIMIISRLLVNKG